MNNRGRPFDRRRGGGFGPGRGRGAPRGHRPTGFHARSAADGPGRRLTERELGIAEYVSSLDGFGGIIKSRYSDFQVSEISPEGELARLTERDAPEPAAITEEEDGDLDVLRKFDVELLPLQTWDALSALAVAGGEGSVRVDATALGKEERGRVYDSVKVAFGARLVGATLTEGDSKIIAFSRPQRGVRTDTREKWRWPEEYVHFLVYKENLDTMEAAGCIAEALRMSHVKPSFFGYCGTKDRRAKTTQFFSLRKVDPARIARSCARLRNITVGNFRFRDYHLKLGHLSGNRFRIALRNVSAPDEDIQRAVDSLRDSGFVNYYGLQRFGSRADIPTYRVGRCLLRGEFQEAVDLILEPHGPFARNFQIYRDTRDAKKAMFGVPDRSFSVEVRLLSGLARGARNDLVSALERIPRNTRLLYIHSYQSWVWNRCVTERIRRFGLEVREGDLVFADPAQVALDPREPLEEGWADEEEDLEKESPRAECKKRGVRYPPAEKREVTVKALTAEDVSNSVHTIFDVVLPLPGFSIEYPPNMKDFYEDIIVKEDSLTLEMKQRVKAYCLSGAYRRMLSKPEDLSWRILRYSDPYCDLIASDLDELRKKPPVEDVPDGKYKALILELTLAPSTYATMALRELLKRDTSSESQAQSNDYHKSDQTGKSPNGEVKIEAVELKAESEKVAEKMKIEVDKLKAESENISESVKADSETIKPDGEMTCVTTKEVMTELSSVCVVEKRKLEEEGGEESKRARLL